MSDAPKGFVELLEAERAEERDARLRAREVEDAGRDPEPTPADPSYLNVSDIATYGVPRSFQVPVFLCPRAVDFLWQLGTASEYRASVLLGDFLRSAQAAAEAQGFENASSAFVIFGKLSEPERQAARFVYRSRHLDIRDAHGGVFEGTFELRAFSSPRHIEIVKLEDQ